jgi:hypothetical protein
MWRAAKPGALSKILITDLILWRITGLLCSEWLAPEKIGETIGGNLSV